MVYEFFSKILRLRKCDKSSFHVRKVWGPYDTKEATEIFQLILFSISPIVCLIGIITNTLVIVTLKHKSNKKDFEDNQYRYMNLNSICNLLILVFQSISLTSECQNFNSALIESKGLFCSKVRTSMFSQFYRIIFLEYFTHVLNIMSNLSYICYSINRLSLIGQEHGKFVTKISKLKLKKFILITFMFCFILPTGKIFSFQPNFNNPYNTYPSTIEDSFSEMRNVMIFLYLSSNILYNLINFVGFILANLIVDINLLLSMRNVMAQRAKNSSRAIQSNETTKK